MYLDVNGNEIFSDIIMNLEEKYSFLKGMKNKQYFYKNKEIDLNKTINSLNIKDNSDITILFKK